MTAILLFLIGMVVGCFAVDEDELAYCFFAAAMILIIAKVIG